MKSIIRAYALKVASPNHSIIFAQSEFFLAERFEVKVAQLCGKPVAGLFNFRSDNQTEYWTPVVNNDGKTCNAIYGLIHHTLTELVGLEKTSLNFGGLGEPN